MIMRFVLTIELGNDAMQTSHDIGRALQNVAKRLLAYPVCDPQPDNADRIRDDNGNRVGGWHVEGESK